MVATVVDSQPPARRASWAVGAALAVVAVVAVGFVIWVALPYFRVDEQVFGVYWPRRGWLLLHVTTGIAALLLGPLQLWIGLRRRPMRLHRQVGLAYLASIAASAVAAFYLAFNTDYGWVFGSGLVALAVAWLVTSGLAFIAIRRRLLQQHIEWMIRSYVVTFAFVTFRILFGALEAAGVGTVPERLGAAAWFCWAVPLLVTEAIMQGRKIFGSPRSLIQAERA